MEADMMGEDNDNDYDPRPLTRFIPAILLAILVWLTIYFLFKYFV